MNNQSRKNEFTAKIAEMASKNPEFRSNLVKNPKETLGKILKMNIPASLNVNVLEDTANSIYIVIPPAGGELNNAELEAIAGGGCWANCGSACS